jgi:hypothetical protein
MSNKKFTAILLAGLISLLNLTPLLAAFSDLESAGAYQDAINYSQQNGIVSGYPDGTFRPANPINRAEFTKIIIGAALNYNSSQDPSGFDIFALSGLPFSDLSGGQWYVPYLRQAYQHNIISGYPDGTFRPANNINFAEASKIIVGAFNLSVQPDNVTWYKPYVGKLSGLKAIPVTINSFDQKISRAEMVEIIYRLKQNITTRESKTYEILNSPATVNPPSSSAGTAAPRIGSCQIFPSDNPWNRDISKDPVDPNSANYINSIGSSINLHADFGGNGEYGIPFSVVSAGQKPVAITITDYADESDPGPYPIPDNARVEGGGDAHVLTLDQDNCVLYELYQAVKTAAGWTAAQASRFDLKSNTLRPEDWTSADAAGLPILPGLVKYDEVAAGAVNHAVRFSAAKTQKAYIHPATHYASSSTDPNLPPMGLRVRLKADFDLSGYTGEARVILEGLKKYGMILADNGSNWFITGAADTRWNDDDLNQLKQVPGGAFEVVQSGPLIKP